MSSWEIHQAGITLESIVSRLQAHLKGKGASNSADYYDYSKGIFDGLASSLEKIESDATYHDEMRGEDNPHIRFSSFLKGAIENIRALEKKKIDPDKIVDEVYAMVQLVGVIEAFHESLKN